MEKTREGETRRMRKDTKVLSQNDVTVTNNKGGHYLLCNLPENLFLCCCRFFARTESFHSTNMGFLSLSDGDKHQARQYPVNHC